MKQLSAFLFVVLVQTLWASAVEARGSAMTGRASLMAGTTFPCTLDVVLVTFRDATSQASGTAYDYHNHDRPHGSNDDGTYPDPDSSYTRREFERLFSGGYGSLGDSALVGDNVRVAKGNHLLPKVFGSVKAYYDSMSNGAFDLHVRMINTKNGDYPRWIELPRTKAGYDTIASDDTRRGNRFWDEAYKAAWDSVQSWNANIERYSITYLPNSDYSLERRKRHKVIYLYSGATYSVRSPDSLLHPQADRITSPGARSIPVS